MKLMVNDSNVKAPSYIKEAKPLIYFFTLELLPLDWSIKVHSIRVFSNPIDCLLSI